MRAAVIAAMLMVSACAGDPSGEIDVTREIGDREYRLVVPATAVAPAPLILVFHGLGGSPQEVRRLAGLDELARIAGFAVAYPRAAGIIPTWRTDPLLAAPDVDFARQVVDDVNTIVDIDSQRVFAAGMSNGGGMAGRLACDAADVFAGVGLVAAAHVVGGCNPVVPVPIVAFHGAADRIVPIDGRGLVRAPGDWISDRATDYGCDASFTAAIAPDVSMYEASGCDAEVVFYVAAEGRHGWPGSERASATGDSTLTIDASAIMWEFFAQQQLGSTSWSR